MAFWTHWETEFNDLYGITWKVQIQEDSVAGSKVTLVSTGSPLHIEWLSASDEYNEPIRPSKATVNVYSETNFALAELYSDEDFKYKVLIYAGADLYWSGWVVTGEYSEPYDQPPYVVSINCVDGLNYLKDILYASSISVAAGVKTVTYYDGRKLESQIILDILGKVGITTFTEYINLYEESMAVTSGDSPSEQLAIDVDIFKDLFCDEVLSEMLRKYNSVIIQKDGVMNIYRPEELTQATVYGRTFTAATTKSSTNFAPVQYINRITNTSNLIQNPGGVMMTKGAIKYINIFQDYVNKESWIDNWELKGGTTSIDAGTWQSWTAVGFTLHPINYWVPNERDGVVINSATSGDPVSIGYGIYQTFGQCLKTTSDVLNFSFDYLFYNYSAGSITTVTLYLLIRSASSSHYLYESDDKYCAWDTGANYVTIAETVAVGSTGWRTFQRAINTGLPVDGPYYVRFYMVKSDGSLDVVGAIKNIKINSTSDVATIKKRKVKELFKLALKKFFRPSMKYTDTYVEYLDFAEVVQKEYVIENSMSTQISKVLDLFYRLGDVTDSAIDNVIEQFAGSLASTLGSLTKVAAAFVADHAADYTAGGVTVTSSGVTVIMTSSVAGQDFTGSTTITNTSGDLAGSVAATQANVTALPEIDTVTISGTGGTCEITCNGTTRLATWDTDIATTCSNFESDWAAEYASAGVTLTSGVDSVIFQAATPGTAFTGDTSIVNISGDLSGLKADTQANRVAVARIDTITLTGTYGTADILCDAVTDEATFKMEHTTDWNTYTGTGGGRTSGGESDPLLEIVGGEIGNQYSRPKQLIQMNIQETSTVDTVLNIIGRIEDEINTFSGNNRTFVFNAGDFDVKPRTWTCDLIEII